VPILILFFWIKDSPQIQLLVLALVVIATITDWLDGWWARKFNCISDFGKTHDPLADKWLVTLYIPLMAMGMIHFIPVTLLWLRDVTTTHLRSIYDGPLPARKSGKIKTAISFPLMCLLIATIPVTNGYLTIFTYLGGFLYWIGGITLSLLCIWSGIDYYIAVMKARKTQNSA